MYLPLREANKFRQGKRKERSAMTRRARVASGSLSFVIARSPALKGCGSLKSPDCVGPRRSSSAADDGRCQKKWRHLRVKSLKSQKHTFPHLSHVVAAILWLKRQKRTFYSTATCPPRVYQDNSDCCCIIPYLHKYLHGSIPIWLSRETCFFSNWAELTL